MPKTGWNNTALKTIIYVALHNHNSCGSGLNVAVDCLTVVCRILTGGTKLGVNENKLRNI